MNKVTCSECGSTAIVILSEPYEGCYFKCKECRKYVDPTEGVPVEIIYIEVAP